jgi:hypothetical protein
MSRGSQPKQRRYVIAAAVREAIGAGPAADVRAGRASPPRYQCLLCDQDGDARRTLTTVILLQEGPADLLAYAHARCLPSQVTTLAAVTAARTATGTPEPPPGPSDVMLGWYGPHAALIADEPATPAMLTPDGAINLALGTWLNEGFAVAVPNTIPPPLPSGWAVHVAGRSLRGVTAPGGWWWQADTAGQAVQLPGEWVTAAHQHGTVAVLAGDIGLADAATGQEFTAAMHAAITAGRVAYGLAGLTEEGRQA